MPNTKIICQGFTKSARIDIPPGSKWEKVSLKSFSCTFNKNILQSQAAMAYATSVKNVRRTKGPFLLDVPSIDLSIEIEVYRDMFNEILNAIANHRNEHFRVNFIDHASGINWLFNECYVTSCSFSISEDSILSVSLSFFVVTDRINFDWNQRSIGDRFGNEELPIRPQYESRGVIPYYDFAVGMGDGSNTLADVMGFSFDFSQSVEPKYECSGSNHVYAHSASHLLFGMPNIEFTLTIFMGGVNDRVNYGDHTSNANGTATTFHDTIRSLNNDTIKLYIRKKQRNSREYEKVLTMTGCVDVSMSPNFDTFPSHEHKYIVNGILKV